MANGEGGRPSEFIENWKDKLTLVEGWARDGLNNEQIAHNMGIHISTLYEWQNKYPEFRESLKRSKEVADYEVENALFKNATIKGDTVAQIFWLKNRKPAQWRDRKEHTELDIMKQELGLKIKKFELAKEKFKSEDSTEGKVAGIFKTIEDNLKQLEELGVKPGEQ